MKNVRMILSIFKIAFIVSANSLFSTFYHTKEEKSSRIIPNKKMEQRC